MKTFALLLLISGIAGCDLFEDDGDPGYRLQVDKKSYTADETVIISLVNLSGETLVYNLCSARLEIFRQGGWTGAESEDRVCKAIGYTLKSLRVASVSRSLAGVPPGTYRFAYDLVEADGSDELRYRKTEHVMIFTSTFDVQ